MVLETNESSCLEVIQLNTLSSLGIRSNVWHIDKIAKISKGAVGWWVVLYILL